MNCDIVPLQLLIVQLSGKVAAKLANTTIYKQMNDSLTEPFSLDLDQFVDKGERILRISFRFESHYQKYDRILQAITMDVTSYRDLFSR